MKHTFLLAQLVIWWTRKLISYFTHTEHACGDSQKISPKLDISKIYNLPSVKVTRPWANGQLKQIHNTPLTHERFNVSIFPLSLFHGRGEVQNNLLSYLAFNDNNRYTNNCEKAKAKTKMKKIRKKQTQNKAKSDFKRFKFAAFRVESMT